MIIAHGRGPVLHQGQQQVMGGGQVLQGNMPQMTQQGPSSAPQGGNMFDELNMDFLWRSHGVSDFEDSLPYLYISIVI